jgi:hypothetical protein
MKMAIRQGGLIVAVGVGTLALSAVANAAPVLKLVSGATTVTVTDNGANDTDARAGIVRYAGPVGSFFASVSTTGSSNSPGQAFPNSPNPFLGILQLESLDARNTDTAGRQTLDIVFSDTGFAGSPDATNKLSSSVGMTLTNTAQGDSVRFQSHLDPTNVAQSFNSVFTTGPQTATANGGQVIQSYSSSNEVSVPASTPANPLFSLTQHVVMDVSAGGQVNLSGTTASNTLNPALVPEPGSLGLAGIGAMAALARRRRRSA